MNYTDTTLQEQRLIRACEAVGISRRVLGIYYSQALEEIKSVVQGYPLAEMEERIDQYLEDYGTKPYLISKEHWLTNERDHMQIDQSAIAEVKPAKVGFTPVLFKDWEVVTFKCTKAEEDTEKNQWKLYTNVTKNCPEHGASIHIYVSFNKKDGKYSQATSSFLDTFYKGEANITPAKVVGKDFQATAYPPKESKTGKKYQSFGKFADLTVNKSQIPF